MPNLETVLEEIEQDLTAILMDAFATTGFGPLRKVYVGSPEEGTTAKDLPYAALLMPGIESDDEDSGVICSESGRLKYEIYLHALKPHGRTLASEKRQRAQTIRTAIKSGAEDIRHASTILWMADTYDQGEDFRIEALSESYVIRVSYQMQVEWED